MKLKLWSFEPNLIFKVHFFLVTSQGPQTQVLSFMIMKNFEAFELHLNLQSSIFTIMKNFEAVFKLHLHLQSSSFMIMKKFEALKPPSSSKFLTSKSLMNLWKYFVVYKTKSKKFKAKTALKITWVELSWKLDLKNMNWVKSWRFYEPFICHWEIRN